MGPLQWYMGVQWVHYNGTWEFSESITVVHGSSVSPLQQDMGVQWVRYSGTWVFSGSVTAVLGIFIKVYEWVIQPEHIRGMGHTARVH